MPNRVVAIEGRLRVDPVDPQKGDQACALLLTIADDGSVVKADITQVGYVENAADPEDSIRSLSEKRTKV